MWVKNKHIHSVQTPESLYCGGACVARRRAYNCDALARAFKRKFKHLPNQLHRKIFECEGRTVEKFHQEMIWRKLHQRRTGGVTEARISAGDAAFELFVSEGVANKRAHNFKRNLFVACATHRANVVSAQLWDGFGNIKATITRKACKHRFFKRENRSCAAR